MGQVRDRESVWALEQRMKGCSDAMAARHVQVIWLLAQGHSGSQVSALTAFSERWVQLLLARYNAEGPARASRARSPSWGCSTPRRAT